MGIAPSHPGIRRATRRKTAVPVPAVAGPVELVVLSVKQKAARCRLLGGDQTFTFRARRLWDLVPGEIAVVKPAKQWTYAGNPYMSSSRDVTGFSVRFDGSAPKAGYVLYRVTAVNDCSGPESDHRPSTDRTPEHFPAHFSCDSV